MARPAPTGRFVSSLQVSGVEYKLGDLAVLRVYDGGNEDSYLAQLVTIRQYSAQDIQTLRVRGLLLDEKVGDARLYVRWL